MRRLFDQAKYMAIIGVISLLLAAVAAFGWGAMKTVSVIVNIVASYGQDPKIAVELIKLVDTFLIATALFIFSASMYELFINKLTLPGWMLAHNLDELKSKLGSVIVLVMAVKFLERLVDWQDPAGTLLFGIAVTIVSATLIMLGYFGKKDHSPDGD